MWTTVAVAGSAVLGGLVAGVFGAASGVTAALMVGAVWVGGVNRRY